MIIKRCVCILKKIACPRKFTINIKYCTHKWPRRSSHKTQVCVNTILFILKDIRQRISANRRNSCTLWHAYPVHGPFFPLYIQWLNTLKNANKFRPVSVRIIKFDRWINFHCNVPQPRERIEFKSLSPGVKFIRAIYAKFFKWPF